MCTYACCASTSTYPYDHMEEEGVYFCLPCVYHFVNIKKNNILVR